MSALADPVLRDLARYEREEDMRAAREELVEARIPVLADHLLDCHAFDVEEQICLDEVPTSAGATLDGEFRAAFVTICRLEARHVDDREADASAAWHMRQIVRDAAERLARDRAEAELDRGDPSCCELERRAMRRKRG